MRWDGEGVEGRVGWSIAKRTCGVETGCGAM